MISHTTINYFIYIGCIKKNQIPCIDMGYSFRLSWNILFTHAHNCMDDVLKMVNKK